MAAPKVMAYRMPAAGVQVAANGMMMMPRNMMMGNGTQQYAYANQYAYGAAVQNTYAYGATPTMYMQQPIKANMVLPVASLPTNAGVVYPQYG